MIAKAINKHFDSLHMALAEGANADIFLTTDDRLIKRAQNTDTRTRVPIL